MLIATPAMFNLQEAMLCSNNFFKATNNIRALKGSIIFLIALVLKLQFDAAQLIVFLK